MRNFDLSLPEETYKGLREEAERTHQPATAIAREAIESWLRQCRRMARHQAISDFAKEFAGTTLDLDPQLEAAAVEHLLLTEQPDR